MSCDHRSWWMCRWKSNPLNRVSFQFRGSFFRFSFMAPGNCVNQVSSLFFSFFLNCMSSHHFYLCGMSFNENETYMTLALRIAWVSWTLNLLTWQRHYEEREERVSWDVRGVSSPWHSSGSHYKKCGDLWRKFYDIFKQRHNCTQSMTIFRFSS